jgi:hypothetical protein
MYSTVEARRQREKKIKNGKIHRYSGLVIMLAASLTVRKMDLISPSKERRPQMQLSMARRFKLQLLRTVTQILRKVL